MVPREDNPNKRHNLITAQRLLKGDMHVTRDHCQYIDTARVLDRSILNYLAERRIINNDHISAAYTYRMWREAFLRQFYAASASRQHDNEGDPVSRQDSEAKYFMLGKLLGPYHSKLVHAAIFNTIPETMSQQTAWDSRSYFQAALDKLITHIETVETACEGVDVLI